MASSKTNTTLLGAGAGAGIGALIGLLGGPIGAGPGAAIGALWVKSQAHWKANEWNEKYQKPWGDKAIDFMNTLWNDRKAGTLTYDDAIARQKEFESNVGAFWDDSILFSGKGKDQKKVVSQAHTSLDSTIASWRDSIQQQVDALKPADPVADLLGTTSETEPPTLDGVAKETTGGLSAEAAGKRAADITTKKAQRADGRASTFLTGPQGLGKLPTDNRRYTTLLGY